MLIIIPYYAKVPQDDKFSVGDLKRGHATARIIASGFKKREDAVDYILQIEDNRKEPLL